MKRTNKPLNHSEEIFIGVGENILLAMRRKVNILLFNSSVAVSFKCVESRWRISAFEKRLHETERL